MSELYFEMVLIYYYIGLNQLNQTIVCIYLVKRNSYEFINSQFVLFKQKA